MLQERKPGPDDYHPRPRRRHEAAGGELLIQAALGRLVVLGHPAFAVADRGVAPWHHDAERLADDLRPRRDKTDVPAIVVAVGGRPP